MITLRPATMDDRDILMQWRKAHEVERDCPPSRRTTEERHDLWLRGWMASMLLHAGEGVFIAEVKGAPIGTGRITLVADDFDQCEIHYYIDLAWRRRTLGAQLVDALVRRAKEEMGYGHVVCSIHRWNAASLKCAVKGGVNAVEFL